MLLQSLAVAVCVLNVAHCMEELSAQIARGDRDIRYTLKDMTSLEGVAWNSAMRSLDLSANKITYVHFETQMPNMETLNLGHNQIQSLRDAKFSSWFPSLKTLDLGYNQLTGDDVFDGMQLPPSLTELEMPHMGLSKKAIQELCDILARQTPNLQSLNIGNYPYSPGVRSLQDAAASSAIQMPSLTKLEMLLIDKGVLDDMMLGRPAQLPVLSTLLIRAPVSPAVSAEEREKILRFFGKEEGREEGELRVVIIKPWGTPINLGDF